MVAPLPVRDFTGCANPEAEMKRHYAESRARMMTPRVVQAVAPIPAPTLATPPTISLIPPPSYVVTKAAYARAARIRRDRETSHRPFLRVVAAITEIPISAITGDCRKTPVSRARMIAAWLIRKGTTQSYPTIGRYLKKDHTSVRHAFLAVERAIRKERIELSDDPVEMCERLWSSVWAQGLCA